MSERPHVSLRPFEPGDAAAVHRWFNNPAATASLMEQRDSFSLEQAEGWTRRAMDNSGEDRSSRSWSRARGSGRLRRPLRAVPPDGAGAGSVDQRRRARQGGGPAGRGADDRPGLRRVRRARLGRIPARNEIAKKTVASLGWVHEGTMRAHLARDGAPPDDCEVWGVLPADEFRAAAADLLAPGADARSEPDDRDSGADPRPRRGRCRPGVLPLPRVPRRRARHPHPPDRCP